MDTYELVYLQITQQRGSRLSFQHKTHHSGPKKKKKKSPSKQNKTEKKPQNVVDNLLQTCGNMEQLNGHVLAKSSVLFILPRFIPLAVPPLSGIDWSTTSKLPCPVTFTGSLCPQIWAEALSFLKSSIWPLRVLICMPILDCSPSAQLFNSGAGVPALGTNQMVWVCSVGRCYTVLIKNSTHSL